MNYSNLYKTTRSIVTSILIMLFITACGGGGQDSTPPPPVKRILPTIVLNGAQSVTIIQGETYSELGAQATDQHGNPLRVTLDMNINLKKVGEYLVTYSASDNEGNEVSITRKIIIVGDSVPPVITITGDNPQVLTIGDQYYEHGANAIDLNDGSRPVSVLGAVDTSEVGIYTIRYTAIDSIGNENTVTREVHVNELPTPFITTWKTDNYGVSDDNQVKIMTKGAGYDYEIDWGDGHIDRHVKGGITHTYATPGTYTVSILGDFPRIYNAARFHTGFGYHQTYGDAEKLLSVEQWGNNKWQSMSSAFMDCEYLDINATDAPDLTQVTDMSYMFSYAVNFNNDISHWDVSNIENMSAMFEVAVRFNQDISNWDVSNVNNMSHMFSAAQHFNQNLKDWDVSNVTSMSYMFKYARRFNQPIGSWDVSNVTRMSGLFEDALAFNQPIGDWNVSNVQSMYHMFAYTNVFNQDISQWNVSNVTSMNGMFALALAFNQDIGDWDVSKVESMKNMLWEAELFNQDLSSWDVSSVKEMDAFLHATSFSNENYELLLNSWSSFNLQSDVEFSAGSAKYSHESESARSILVNTYNWNISDGGLLLPIE